MSERAARLIFIAMLCWLPSAFAEVAITSSRIWPAQDYTRLTIESKQSIRYNLFTLKNPELEEKFVKEAKAKGFIGLKGHRSVGGIRASVYNAMPVEGCKKLAEFMAEFMKQNP